MPFTVDTMSPVWIAREAAQEPGNTYATQPRLPKICTSMPAEPCIKTSFRRSSRGVDRGSTSFRALTNPLLNGGRATGRPSRCKAAGGLAETALETEQRALLPGVGEETCAVDGRAI